MGKSFLASDKPEQLRRFVCSGEPPTGVVEGLMMMLTSPDPTEKVPIMCIAAAQHAQFET